MFLYIFNNLVILMIWQSYILLFLKFKIPVGTYDKLINIAQFLVMIKDFQII